MTPIIIESNKITKLFSIFIPVAAITIFPFIIVSSEYNNKTTINHETIHIEQQKELYIVFFYILYVYYWLKGKIKGMTNVAAYMSIPFEKEAYLKQYDDKYLLNRKRHSWKKYAA
tara:strand:- start:99 stop:443 length:345 start_codon:yes stop_codon:yes gene_type:complete